VATLNCAAKCMRVSPAEEATSERLRGSSRRPSIQSLARFSRHGASLLPLDRSEGATRFAEARSRATMAMAWPFGPEEVLLGLGNSQYCQRQVIPPDVRIENRTGDPRRFIGVAGSTCSTDQVAPCPC
jgi:hypothetical protein